MAPAIGAKGIPLPTALLIPGPPDKQFIKHCLYQLEIRTFKEIELNYIIVLDK